MTQVDWTPLDQELDAWRQADLTVPIWWRDDDAIISSDALTRLTSLSREVDIPVHLAVIPSRAQKDLAKFVAAHPNLVPLVHGWAHLNHEKAPAKKCEFGIARPLDDCITDARDGFNALRSLFGVRFSAIFVPPWNRVRPDLMPHLSDIGYQAVSTFGPRSSLHAAPSLIRINTHLDPVFWRGTRSLVEPTALIAQLCHDLAARRNGRLDNSEPYGLLTHHLVHDSEIWDFTQALMARLALGPVSRWRADRHLTTKEDTP